MHRNYSVVDHSSDLMIRAYGNNFLEALANASAALTAEAVQADSPQELEERFLQMVGNDESQRAIAFLNEIVYLIYGCHWLPYRVRRLTTCSSHGCPSLDAVVSGEPVDMDCHVFRHEIKAVTYHDFVIREEKGLTVIQFVCDL